MEERGESGNLQGPAGHAEAPGRQRRVFISYASNDAALAQKVCSALEATGILCWIAPRDVIPGTLYADGIVGAIDESSILVLVLSKEAVASAHVGRELERAASKRHAIIALRTDTAPLTRAFEYFLNQSQWIETGNGGIDTAIAQLVAAVARHLSPGSAAASANAPKQPTTSRDATPRRLWIIAGAVAVLALIAAYFLADSTWLHGHSATDRMVGPNVTVGDKSIAILPFVDMSEKKDQEYFADGMAEEIIDLLVKVPGLKVIGRTSSFQFKGKTEDLRNIGTLLGVAFVLEGSVRKSGDHIRVTAQLINTKDGAHLWSRTYDRNLSDVLKMQDEIAAQVARALETEVSAVDALVSRPALRNTEAYTLSLQGLHAFERSDQQGIEQALNYFQRALDLDPQFADAAVGIGFAYKLLGEDYYMPAPEAFEQARRFAQQALKLEPNNANAHMLLANIYLLYDWDWAAADSELKRARDLSPNDPLILFLSGQQSRIMGRWDEALKLMNTVVELDSLLPDGYEIVNFIQVRRGQLAEAEAAIRRTLEITPTFSFAHYSLGVVLVIRGQGEAALAEMLKEPDERARSAGSAIAYFSIGRKTDSNTALERWLSGAKAFPYTSATIYAFRGELDEAFKCLDRAYLQKDARLPFIKGEVLLKNLEGDPRYKAFLKKMNLPE